MPLASDGAADVLLVTVGVEHAQAKELAPRHEPKRTLDDVVQLVLGERAEDPQSGGGDLDELLQHLCRCQPAIFLDPGFVELAKLIAGVVGLARLAGDGLAVEVALRSGDMGVLVTDRPSRAIGRTVPLVLGQLSTKRSHRLPRVGEPGDGRFGHGAQCIGPPPRRFLGWFAGGLQPTADARAAVVATACIPASSTSSWAQKS